MARPARLNAAGPRGRPARLLLLLVAVLAGHALVLYWLAHARAPASRLRLLETPMFTRLLQPTAPPAIAQAAAAGAAPPVRRRTVARQVPARTPSLATPTAPSSEPSSQPPAETSAPPGPDPAEDAPATAIANAAEPAEAAAPVPPEPAEAAAPTAPDRSNGAASAAKDEAAGATSAAAPAAPALDSWPRDTRLSYELSGRFRSGDLYGNARVQWQREGTRYQTRVEIDLPPWISQVLTSQGEVGADSLRPELYEETRRGKSRGARVGEESITLGNGERVARPEGVQDTASQFVELSHRFATGRERLEVGRSVSLWLVRPGGVDLWTYDIVALETLRTPELGAVEAFHLKPRPLARPRGNISAEMWFAPSLQFLPVRIRVTMGEEAEVDLMVSTIEQR